MYSQQQQVTAGQIQVEWEVVLKEVVIPYL